MKSFRRRMVFAIGAVLICVYSAHGELQRWVQDLDVKAQLESIFFKTVALPRGPVQSRRPPAETTAELTRVIVSQPTRTDLLYLRARERELNLDFANAEKDWIAYASAAKPTLSAHIALADFYHRRLEPAKELTALIEAGQLPAEGSDRFDAVTDQGEWKAFERAAALISDQALAGEATNRLFSAWLQRYGDTTITYQKAFGAFAASQDWTRAESVLEQYTRAFPSDSVFPLQMRATFAEKRGNPADAASVYEKAWNPLWSPSLVKSYFEVLTRTHTLHQWLANARNAAVKSPTELDPAVRLFYHHQQRGDLEQAWRSLRELRIRKERAASKWTRGELLVVAKLFESTNNVVEAARYYADAYAMDRSSDKDAEDALACLAHLLLTAADQPIAYGAGDLTYYRDVATMDRSPGVLNGILSLTLNTTYPQTEFAEQQSAAVAYFHRAKAVELVSELNSRFPQSARRASLNALIIEAYSKHGEDSGVIRRGTEFLSAFPKSPERVDVALAIADAHARAKQITQEFAIYDSLLQELAAESANHPIGASKSPMPPTEGEGDQPASTTRPPARSPLYLRVLDRYLARLVANERVRDGLAVYRREIDRNPDDAGLYERLAQFMSQNRMDAQLADVYARAARQFTSDSSWYAKLARWQLRRKQNSAFAGVVQQVVDVFSGTEIESFFKQVVAEQPVGPALYLQLNKYAHDRFPHNMAFVRNLLSAYSTAPTANALAYEKLLREHWYYDDDLRQRFFSFLSRNNRLEGELQALGASTGANDDDRVKRQFMAEGRAWQSHFEQATEALDQVAKAYPGDNDLALRVASLYRSLDNLPKAVAAAERIAQSTPRDSGALVRLGEFYADRELFDRARSYWDRIPRIQPGRSDGALEAATVFWDYFQYDDALRIIKEARQRSRSPSLLAYEAGAIHEGRRDWSSAVNEYMSGAMESLESPARRRLMTLATRPALRPIVEQAVTRMTSGSDPALPAFALRVAMLEEQQRRDDLSRYLQGLIGSAKSNELLEQMASAAERQGLDNIRAAVYRREIELTNDPIERIRLRLALMHFLETHNDVPGASGVINALLRENPTTLGVVRAAVDFDWRNQRRPAAIDALAAAAARANGVYRRSFIVEAGTKANEAGEYARARQVTEPLLQAEPQAVDLIAIHADSFARAGQDQALRAFYEDKLKNLSNASARQSLRRSLIPVLSRLKDSPGALDQYIALLNQFSDDRGLLAETAQYAREHNLRDRLTGYYNKAAADSPKDARWPILLARLANEFEDPATAVSVYAKAIAMRPERQDLLIERATLQERLRQWDEAATSYAKLYELAYRDPQWMGKVAEQRARQGRSEDAVKALRTAFIENKPARGGDYLEVARLLESWNFLTEASSFAEQGISKLTAEERDLETKLDIYMRIAMRQRSYVKALVKVLPLMDEAGTKRLWRVGAATASQYYTPEEKQSLALFFEKSVPHDAGIASAAGLLDVAARWMAQEKRTQELISLEQSRMRFSQAAAALEQLAKQAEESERSNFLIQAADNYRLAGATQNELRVLTSLERSNSLSGPLLSRYGDLLRTTAPERLVELARASSKTVRNSAAQTALAGADATLALRVIAAASTGRTPLWGRAYTALAGLYFARTSPEVIAAFDAALGPRTIGEQLAKAADRKEQFAGDDWFYYGARYGEFLMLAKRDAADEFLPAELEGSPASVASYLALADWYRSTANLSRAVEEYAHVIELAPETADAHTYLAEIYAATGKRSEAKYEFRAAIGSLSAMQDEKRVPETFWSGLAKLIGSVEKAGMISEVRPDLDPVVTTYVHRNGSYRMDEVIAPWLQGSSPEAILTLARSAREPADFLSAVVDQPWIPAAWRPLIYARLLEIAEAEMNKQFGEARGTAEERVRELRVRQFNSALALQQYSEAAKLLANIPQSERTLFGDRLTSVEVRTAAGANRLEGLLETYRNNPDKAPATAVLLDAASQVRRDGNQAASQRVLLYVYSRELSTRNFVPANFLGLADVQLQMGDTAAALATLHRMANVAPDAGDSLIPAAQLLEKYGKTAEAKEFWLARVTVAPWDTVAGVAVAHLADNQAALAQIAASKDAPYSARARAASFLAAAGSLGSTELDQLTKASTPSAATAAKPYFYFARLRVAEATKDAVLRLRLLREALEIDPAAEKTRAAILRTALAANRPAAALGAVHNLTGDYRGRTAAPTEIGAYQAENFLRTLNLGDTERATLAIGLGSASEKQGQLASAVYFYRIAQMLNPNVKTTTQIDAITTRLERERLNRERMPTVTDGTTQPNRVRPRITAAAGGNRV